MLSFLRGEREFDAPYNDEEDDNTLEDTSQPRKNVIQLAFSDELALFQLLNLNDACKKTGEASWEDGMGDSASNFLSHLYDSFKEKFGTECETEDIALAWETRMPISDDENSDDSSEDSWKEYGRSRILPNDFVSQEKFLAGSRFLIFRVLADDSSCSSDDSAKVSDNGDLQQKEFGPSNNPTENSQADFLPHFKVVRLPTSWPSGKQLCELGDGYSHSTNSKVPQDHQAQSKPLDTANFINCEISLPKDLGCHNETPLTKQFGKLENLTNEFCSQGKFVKEMKDQGSIVIQWRNRSSERASVKEFGKANELPKDFISQAHYLESSSVSFENESSEQSEENSTPLSQLVMQWKKEVFKRREPTTQEKPLKKITEILKHHIENLTTEISVAEDEGVTQKFVPSQLDLMPWKMELFGGKEPDDQPQMKEFGIIREDFVGQEDYLKPSKQIQSSEQSLETAFSNDEETIVFGSMLNQEDVLEDYNEEGCENESFSDEQPPLKEFGESNKLSDGFVGQDGYLSPRLSKITHKLMGIGKALPEKLAFLRPPPLQTDPLNPTGSARAA